MLAVSLGAGSWNLLAEASGQPSTSGAQGAGATSARPTPGLTLPREFADPAVLADGDGYVAYSTGADGLHVPVVTTDDLRIWTAPTEALPDRPVWSTSGPVWAPAVTRRADGTYLLAYSAREDASGHMCVSVATSRHATGPFVDASAAPLVCDHEAGGSIDPNFFVDTDGSLWLLWKAEGVTGGQRPQLHSQQLDPKALTLRGTPHLLLVQDLPWEDPLVENPALVLMDGFYLLLYSGNRWETAGYATGWAICASPAGPCRKANDPLMRSDDRRSGPGGASWFLTADGIPWIAYHGWLDGRAGHGAGGTRALYLARARLKDEILLVTT